MVLKELVTKCNEDLRELRGQAYSESPALVKVIDILISLTDLDASEAAQTATENKPALVPSKSAEPAAPCEHTVTDLYGRCKQCGECQHTNEKNGTCITCGESVDVPA